MRIAVFGQARQFCELSETKTLVFIILKIKKNSMSKSKIHKERIIKQRIEIIQDIISEIVSNNAERISLPEGIIFNYIDAENFEIIKQVSINERVYLDDGNSVKILQMQDLSTEQLNSILEELENKRFDVEE